MKIVRATSRFNSAVTIVRDYITTIVRELESRSTLTIVAPGWNRARLLDRYSQVEIMRDDLTIHSRRRRGQERPPPPPHLSARHLGVARVTPAWPRHRAIGNRPAHLAPRARRAAC